MAIVQSSGGAHGKAWLLPPRHHRHVLADDEMAVNLRRRLLFPDPNGRQGLSCGHKAVGGDAACAHVEAAPDWGIHPLACYVGAGWDLRHDGIRDALFTWLKRRFGAEVVAREQHVPAWSRAKPDGSIEHAVLDVLLMLPGRGRMALDVSVTDAANSTNRRPAARAKAGTAAKSRETEKHHRCAPNTHAPSLVPIVYEAGGRAGREADWFLRSVVADTDSQSREEVLRDLRQDLSIALMRGNATLLLSAGPPPGGWPWRRQRPG